MYIEQFICLILILFPLLIVFVFFAYSFIQEKRKKETEQLINYLLSLSPERREIELALLQVKSTKAVASSINYQTVMQMFNKK